MLYKILSLLSDVVGCGIVEYLNTFCPSVYEWRIRMTLFMGDVGAQHRNSLPHQRHTHTTHIHIEQPAQSHGIQCTAPQLQSQYPLQQRHYDALNYYLGLERIRYGMCEMAFIGIQYGFMYVIWETSKNTVSLNDIYCCELMYIIIGHHISVKITLQNCQMTI